MMNCAFILLAIRRHASRMTGKCWSSSAVRLPGRTATNGKAGSNLFLAKKVVRSFVVATAPTKGWPINSVETPACEKKDSSNGKMHSAFANLRRTKLTRQGRHAQNCGQM